MLETNAIRDAIDKAKREGRYHETTGAKGLAEAAVNSQHGATVGAISDAPAKRKRPVELVKASFAYPATWTIPVETASEVNGRDWRKRSKRSDAAWRAVSLAMGPRLVMLGHFAELYHRGLAVRITLTRLGGNALDRSNLPTSLKAVEDAVAFMMGANDGDPRWHAEWHQRPGGPKGVEIRIEPAPEPKE